MLPGFLQQWVTSKVKAIPEKVRETLELLAMDFSNFDKYKAFRNSKDGSKLLLLWYQRYR